MGQRGVMISYFIQFFFQKQYDYLSSLKNVIQCIECVTLYSNALSSLKLILKVYEQILSINFKLF